MITIVDYGMGNIGSIKNMLKHLNVDFIVSANPDDIKVASKLILPGVGAFDAGMRNLQKQGLIEVLSQKVLRDSTPILGICLGMQLMTLGSEEGTLKGLGWLKAKTNKFDFSDRKLKVPHMGWNTINVNKNSKLFKKHNDEESRFYFVHSYYVDCDDKQDVLMSTNYSHDFVSAFEKNNIYGVQFHPEKSHKFGLELFRNFLSI